MNEESSKAWDLTHDDDFIILRSEVGRTSRLIDKIDAFLHKLDLWRAWKALNSINSGVSLPVSTRAPFHC